MTLALHAASQSPGCRSHAHTPWALGLRQATLSYRLPRAHRPSLFSITYELQSCVTTIESQPCAKHRGVGYPAISKWSARVPVACGPLLDVVAEDYSALHHEFHSFCLGDVCQWVSGN